MIEYVARSGPPEAMECPAFICDRCREQVVGSGNVLWWSTTRDRWRSSPIFVAHKGCTSALEQRLETTYPRDEGWIRRFDEVKRFLPQLTHNATNAFADDPEGAYHPHQLKLPV